MSIYITTENQTLLWNTVKKIALFEKLSTEEREPWFREITQKFYENNRFKTLSLTELKQLNRDTITYMMNSLKELDHRTTFSYEPYPSSHGAGPSTFSSALSLFPLQHQPVVNFPTNDTTALKQTDEVTRNFFSNQKKDTLNKQYLERRQEYETMNQKVVPEIDFRLSVEDNGPIGQTSMEEMVRLQNIQRRQEFEPVPVSIKKETVEQLVGQKENVEVSTRSVLPSAIKKLTIEKVINPPEKKVVRWNVERVERREEVSFYADEKPAPTKRDVDYIMESDRSRSPIPVRSEPMNLSRLKDEIRQELQKELHREMQRELQKEVDDIKRMMKATSRYDGGLFNGSALFQSPLEQSVVPKVRVPRNIIFDTPGLLVEDVVSVEITTDTIGDTIQFSRELV